jgi:hypothetical protein
VSRRSIAFIAVVSALILAAVAVFLFAPPFRRGGDPVELPPAGTRAGDPMSNIPGPLLSFAPGQPLAPGADDAPLVLATLSRESEYTAFVTAYWAWEGGSRVKYYNIYVSGSRYRADELGEDGDVLRSILCIGDTLYYSTPGSLIYEGPRGGASIDDFASIPTYEDLIALPEGVITNLGYEPEGEYIVVYTSDDIYDAQYVISIDTGCLRQAVFRAPGGQEDVFRADIERTGGAPPEDVFAVVGR